MLLVLVSGVVGSGTSDELVAQLRLVLVIGVVELLVVLSLVAVCERRWSVGGLEGQVEGSSPEPNQPMIAVVEDVVWFVVCEMLQWSCV